MYLGMNLDFVNPVLFIVLKRGALMTKKARNFPSHPLCDAYFVSRRKELVMIEITESSSGAVRGVVNNLEEFILIYGSSIKSCHNCTVRGVVLGPLYQSETLIQSDRVELVYGTAAKKLLGGLQQTLTWIPTKGI
jgi:hypothetical protein